MANSRLERIGTIYSRVTGLLRAGAMKTEDKPLWYDVYQNFPPKYQPKFERAVPKNEIPKIFYSEDLVRAKIHKEKSAVVGTVKLSDKSHKTNTQKCLEYYNEFEIESENSDEALNKAVEKVLEERQLRKDENVSNIAEEFKQAQRGRTINVTDIFKER